MKQVSRFVYTSFRTFIDTGLLTKLKSQAAAATLRQTTSTLELLIVNAGVALGGGALVNLKSSDFLQNLNANVVGPHNILKAFYSFLIESKAEKKTVVLMSSIAGSIAALPNVTSTLKNMFSKFFINCLFRFL